MHCYSTCSVCAVNLSVGHRSVGHTVEFKPYLLNADYKQEGPFEVDGSAVQAPYLLDLVYLGPSIVLRLAMFLWDEWRTTGMAA